MGLIDERSGNANQEPQQPSGASASGNHNAQTQKGGGWHLGQGMFGAPISVSMGGEHLSKLQGLLTEIYKGANQAVEISLLSLDRNEIQALAFSGLMVCARIKDMPDVVAYHLMLLESTGEPIQPLYESINGMNVEVMRLPCDAVDSVMVKRADERVKAAYPGAKIRRYVDAEVIPRDFNMDNQQQVHALAVNAILACCTELEISRPDFEDLNLGTLKMDGSQLVADITFGNTQVEDAVGLPVRAAANLDLFAKRAQGQQNRQTVNSGDANIRICRLSGFLDLVWNPASGSGAMLNPYMAQQAQNTQKYNAMYVITDVTSGIALTPSAILLAIANAMGMAYDSTWVMGFRPTQNVGKKEIDMHDIGAVNIEANLLNDPSGVGQRIDTHADTFTLTDLGQLVGALVQPGLMIGLDCPESGPQSWYLSVFAAAANGNENAYKAIVKAANELTNGRFSSNFPTNAPIFVNPAANNRIHLGYYFDRNGQKRDIRDFDYIAVANLVERTPETLRGFSDTYLRTEYPMIQRLDARSKIIRGLAKEHVTFTGFAQRTIFSSEFLKALATSIQQTGVTASITTPLSVADFRATRATADFASTATMLPGQQTFMGFQQFARGGQAYGAGQQYGQFRF